MEANKTVSALCHWICFYLVLLDMLIFFLRCSLALTFFMSLLRIDFYLGEHISRLIHEGWKTE